MLRCFGLCGVGVVLVATVAATSVRGESVPEFSLDFAVKNATHIVVVDEAGKVLERLRGELRVGVELPFKAAEKPQAVVTVPGVAESKVREVTGRRRVLFLTKDGGGRGFDLRPVRYVPVGALKQEISLATVWIENDECFAIYQWMNPGPGANLHPLNLSEKRLREEIAAKPK